MKVGFVGAGKVGFSLGKMFQLAGENVAGYFSRSPHSAEEAADFTHSKFYKNLETIIKESDAIFLTVPDDEISNVWNSMKKYPLAGKMICHCSGSLSSKVFSDIEKTDSYGFSVHPLLAVSDRYDSCRYLPNSLFTIEGDKRKINEISALIRNCGAAVELISPEVKIRYHAAAVMCSNLIVALIDSAQNEFRACGFSEEKLNMAIAPLVRGNVERLLSDGALDALTGPVERGDTGTVAGHLTVLDGTDREIYTVLSQKALEIARKKHPDRNYESMEELLKKE